MLLLGEQGPSSDPWTLMSMPKGSMLLISMRAPTVLDLNNLSDFRELVCSNRKVCQKSKWLRKAIKDTTDAIARKGGTLLTEKPVKLHESWFAIKSPQFQYLQRSPLKIIAK